MERDANEGDGARPPPFRSLHASAIACSSSSSSTPHWYLPSPEPIASLVPQISIDRVLETLTLVSESLTKETPNPVTRQVHRVSLLR